MERTQAHPTFLRVRLVKVDDIKCLPQLHVLTVHWDQSLFPEPPFVLSAPLESLQTDPSRQTLVRVVALVASTISQVSQCAETAQSTESPFQQVLCCVEIVRWAQRQTTLHPHS
jgi:hypothetical protein